MSVTQISVALDCQGMKSMPPHQDLLVRMIPAAYLSVLHLSFVAVHY